MKEQKLHQGHFGKKPQKAVKSGQYNKIGDTTKISHAAKLHTKILHAAKTACKNFTPCENFAPCENFTACKILCNFHSSSVFSSNCYLLCPCSFELGSGSSHLNWLEERGTIGLQNYKKYSQNVISSIVRTLVQLGYLS